MKTNFTIFLLLSLVCLQTVEAQRGTQRATPRGNQRGTAQSATGENQFKALSEDHIENAINLLGIQLGQSLAEAKKIVEQQGGEITWLASPYADYELSTQQLQRATSLDYFEYAAHSTKNPDNKYVTHTPYSREDIVIKLTVYPKAAGDLKDPNNLIIYKAETYLGFQPTQHEVNYNNANFVDYTYEDFHAVMAQNNYTLYQHQQTHLSYNKKGGQPLDIGDMKAARGTWINDDVKTAGSYNLSSINAFFPTYTNNLMETTANGVDQVIVYKPLGAMIDAFQGAGTFQTYLDYGYSVSVDLIQRTSKTDPNIYLLNNLTLRYEDANLMEDAYTGFYKALFKD